jgi:septum formation topological specificity factor MinE
MSAKVERMQSLFTQSIQSSDAKFSQMFDKFNTIINKWIDVEKDNTELKTKLQNTTHTITLEKEIIKSHLEFDLKTTKRHPKGSIKQT